ncbi:MAG: pantoate--beta-alanine ligase [Bacteroidota bacterium]
MLIYKKAKDFISYLHKNRSLSKSIGFVPTMGALHAGHTSLIKKAKLENDISICSIFINPSQFNQKTDFDKYPITTDKDIEILSNVNCDVLYLPSVEDIYPNGWESNSKIDIGNLATIWEGKFRPGHFDGVVQIVNLFLELIQPNKLYLGQKDFQQCAVIKKLIAIQQYPIEVDICETIREEDGLAMSSRNARLNSVDRQDALCLYKALFYIKNNFLLKSNEVLLEEAKTFFNGNSNIKLEYICIVDRETLDELPILKENAVALVVAWVGEVRLIDNILLY